jgi:hypothetical protein
VKIRILLFAFALAHASLALGDAIQVPGFSGGRETILMTSKIDAKGGTLKGPSGSPIEGISVKIPAGIFSAATALSMGYNDGKITNLAAGTPGEVALVLHSSGRSAFDKPLEITIPDPDPENPVVLFYADGDNKIHPLTSIGTDAQANTATFDVWHFSTFPSAKLPADQSDVTTPFVPGKDGFAIENRGFEYHPRGACFGMASFALWNFKSNGGGLYSQFLLPVPSFLGDSVTAERVLASRAQSAVIKYYDYYLGQMSTGMSGRRLKALLKATGMPALLILMGAADGNDHAVLAIGTKGKDILVYDPNRPGQAVHLTPGSSEGSTVPASLSVDGKSYLSFSSWWFVGDGAIAAAEPFSYMLKDAQQGFHDENETKIDITSHKNGGQVGDPEVTLKAKLGRGQVDITEIEVFYPSKDDPSGETSKKVSIEDGQEEFQVDLKLQPGENKIRFVTRGKPMNDLEDIPNNWQATSEATTFILKAKGYGGTFTFGAPASEGSYSGGLQGTGAIIFFEDCPSGDVCLSSEGTVSVTVDKYSDDQGTICTFAPATASGKGHLILDPVATGGKRGQYTWQFIAQWTATATCTDNDGNTQVSAGYPLNVVFSPLQTGATPCSGGQYFPYSDPKHISGSTSECVTGPLSWSFDHH